MSARNTSVTRTFGPLHFEDLDPHRFEDLVRELIYDLRDWQSIEATGRSGGDDGYDVRAYERLAAPPTVASVDEDDPEADIRPMDGNRWMIQVKREKAIGPAQIRKILTDIEIGDLPYGYVLAAPANFSKTSYDVFRNLLSQKGVMEFYIWGRAELEDMLHLPKFDRVLFTFFGFSLVSKRRAKATEMRSAIISKNKLYKICGKPRQEHFGYVLLRDMDDKHYPFKKEIADFDRRPRWFACLVREHHPRGLFVKTAVLNAYIDRENKQYDYLESPNLIVKHSAEEESDLKRSVSQKEIIDFMDYLPRSSQGTLSIYKIIKYENIDLIDAEGDGLYDIPHIFLRFSTNDGPFGGKISFLDSVYGEMQIQEDWGRVDILPALSQTPRITWNLRKDRLIAVAPKALAAFKKYGDDLDSLYCTDESFVDLQLGDVVRVCEDDPSQPLLRVTHKSQEVLSRYLQRQGKPYQAREYALQQLGRDISEDAVVTVIETRRAFLYELETQKDDY